MQYKSNLTRAEIRKRYIDSKEPITGEPDKFGKGLIDCALESVMKHLITAAK